MRTARAALFVATLGAVIGTGCAGTGPSASQLEQDVRELRQEFEALRRELQQRLLIPPPPVVPLDVELALTDAPMKGDRAAPVTVLEFSDYQCPFCGRYARDTQPELDRAYVATGQVRYLFLDLPLPMHKEAPKAAEAAHCAGDQGKYWEMHDTLFAEQKALAPGQLKAHAAALGLDSATFAECLDGGTHAQRVAAGLALAAQLGLRATPAVLVGRSDGDKITNVTLIRGAQPFATYQQQIEALLAASQPRQ